jgi:hypothetical protein
LICGLVLELCANQALHLIGIDFIFPLRKQMFLAVFSVHTSASSMEKKKKHRLFLVLVFIYEGKKARAKAKAKTLLWTLVCLA